MSTAPDVSAGAQDHTVAFNAAWAKASGNKVVLNQKATLAVTKAEEARQSLLAAQALLQSLSGGTGNTSGSHPTVARMKAALVGAPSSVSAIPRGNSITVTQVASRENPSFPGANGGLVRHYFSPDTWNNRAAGQGSPDLLTVTKTAYPELLGPAYDGAANFTLNNGSSSTQYWWTNDIGDFAHGFKFNGRYLGFCCRFPDKVATLTIDGILQPAMEWTQPDSYIIVDLGSRAQRNIVFMSGAMQFAEIAHPPGDTMEPYDFMAGKIRYNAFHDSWGQRVDYTPGTGTFLRLPSLIARCIGAHSVGGSVRGGTGYYAGDVPATDAGRRTTFAAGSPDFACNFMIVNDPDPNGQAGFQTAVNLVLTRSKADLPNAVQGCCVWTSQGSRAVSGGEVRKRDVIYAEWLKLSGPKIFFDALKGTWYADKGDGVIKQRATAVGPIVTGEGTLAGPIADGGNANTWIDEPGGRHPTDVGTRGLVDWFVTFYREALAVM